MAVIKINTEWTIVSTRWPDFPLSKHPSRSKRSDGTWNYRLTREPVHLYGYGGAKKFKNRDHAIGHLDKIAMERGIEVVKGWVPKRVWWTT